MAGKIIISKNHKDGFWHASPDFICPGMGYDAKKPEGIGRDPWYAFTKLIPKMPEGIQSALYARDRWDMYWLPESENFDVRCIEVDGHKPSKKEFYERRNRYLVRRDIKAAISK